MKRPTHSRSRRAFAASGLTALATLGLSRLSFAQAAATATQGAATSGKSVPPEVEKANIAVVNEFCAAFERKDVAKALSLLSDNCVYRVVQSRAPLVGKEKVSENVKGLIERGAQFKLYKTVAIGPLVLNDRDDILVRATGGTITVRLTGFFYVEDGKIAEWTDYVIR